MSDHTQDERLGAPTNEEPRSPEAAEPTAEEELKASHNARAQSAASRAASVSHYIEQGAGHEPSVDEPEQKEIVWKAAHAARVAAQAVAVLAESAPAPAADARCARNAATSAAKAAQMGQLFDNESALSVAACRAAVQASQAAAQAAAAKGQGEDRSLNARADEAEASAVAAAEAAGWMQPGQEAPQVPTGVRSPELMAMMHL